MDAPCGEATDLGVADEAERAVAHREDEQAALEQRAALDEQVGQRRLLVGIGRRHVGAGRVEGHGEPGRAVVLECVGAGEQALGPQHGATVDVATAHREHHTVARDV
jgi:hypothetical protein